MYVCDSLLGIYPYTHTRIFIKYIYSRKIKTTKSLCPHGHIPLLSSLFFVKAQLLTTLCGPLQCSHIFIGDHVLVAILSLYVVHTYAVQPNGEK